MSNNCDAQKEFVDVFQNKTLQNEPRIFSSSMSLEKFQILSKTLNRWVKMYDTNGAYSTLVNQSDSIKEIYTFFDRFYNKNLISGEAVGAF